MTAAADKNFLARLLKTYCTHYCIPRYYGFVIHMLPLQRFSYPSDNLKNINAIDLIFDSQQYTGKTPAKFVNWLYRNWG